MKKTIIICLSLLSMSSFSQCVECESFAEAQKNAEKVKSIQINSYMSNEKNEIPDSIEKYINLEELYLTDLNLKIIPKGIGKLKKLKSVSFAGNNLKTLPEEIFQLQNLEELILFSNKFTKTYKDNLKKEVKLKLPKTKLMID